MPFCKRSLITCLLLISIPLWAADPESDPTQETPAKTLVSTGLPDPVAVVNDVPISRAMVEAYVELRQNQAGNDQPIDLDNLIAELVNQELLLQEAEQQKLVENNPQLALQLKLSRRSQITTAAVGQLLKSQALNDEAVLKQEYEQVAPSLRKKQYKARHILVDKEEKAQELITTLEEGSDFSEVAKSSSSDNSAERGGDLGWLAAEMMPEPFAQAVGELEKGKFTQKPVETRFGWHIIQLDDVRTTEPPSFEELRPQLANQLRGRIIKEHLDALRAAAQIDIKTDE